MKKALKTLVVVLVVAGSLGAVMLAPAAEAARAKCFKLLGNPAAPRPVNCEQLYGTPLPPPLSGPAGASYFQDNKCYLLGWGLFEANANSPDCRAWQDGRTLDTAPGGDGPGGGPAGSTTNPGDGSLENPSRQTECTGDCINDNYLVVMAKWAVNILGAAVGVVVVVVIVFSGIEYSSSGGDPNRTASAKARIINAIIALVSYMFLYIALQWLIPGGLFA